MGIRLGKSGRRIRWFGKGIRALEYQTLTLDLRRDTQEQWKSDVDVDRAGIHGILPKRSQETSSSGKRVCRGSVGSRSEEEQRRSERCVWRSLRLHGSQSGLEGQRQPTSVQRYGIEELLKS